MTPVPVEGVPVTHRFEVIMTFQPGGTTEQMAEVLMDFLCNQGDNAPYETCDNVEPVL